MCLHSSGSRVLFVSESRFLVSFPIAFVVQQPPLMSLVLHTTQVVAPCLSNVKTFIIISF